MKECLFVQQVGCPPLSFSFFCKMGKQSEGMVAFSFVSFCGC
jgi:hypothetical protein